MEIGRGVVGCAVTGQREGRLPFQALLQEVSHGAIGWIAEGQSDLAGSIQALGAILFGQANDDLTLAYILIFRYPVSGVGAGSKTGCMMSQICC